MKIVVGEDVQTVEEGIESAREIWDQSGIECSVIDTGIKVFEIIANMEVTYNLFGRQINIQKVAMF